MAEKKQPAVLSGTFKVRATRPIFYGHMLRPAGEEFVYQGNIDHTTPAAKALSGLEVLSKEKDGVAVSMAPAAAFPQPQGHTAAATTPEVSPDVKEFC